MSDKCRHCGIREQAEAPSLDLDRDMCQECIDTGIGTEYNPYITFSPCDDIPYGSYCKCDRCGRVDRSTYIHDFFKIVINCKSSKLKCEYCARATMNDKESKKKMPTDFDEKAYDLGVFYAKHKRPRDLPDEYAGDESKTKSFYAGYDAEDRRQEED